MTFLDVEIKIKNEVHVEETRELMTFEQLFFRLSYYTPREWQDLQIEVVIKGIQVIAMETEEIRESIIKSVEVDNLQIEKDELQERIDELEDRLSNIESYANEILDLTDY